MPKEISCLDALSSALPPKTRSQSPASRLPAGSWATHIYTSLTTLGALSWVIPLLDGDLDTIRGIYEQLDGVFLPGGVDMDPDNYGETPSAWCGRLDKPRDQVEMALARWALADHKPILGVCRGIQVMNVAAGGTLYQDVQAQRDGAIKHDYYPYTGKYTRDQLIHDVQIEPDSRLGRLLGEPNFMVNSMHHQGIRTLAPGFIPSGHAPDGLIESIESPNGQFAVGVQWHPEEFVTRDPATRRLFMAFLDAATAWGNRNPRSTQHPAPSTLL